MNSLHHLHKGGVGLLVLLLVAVGGFSTAQAQVSSFSATQSAVPAGDEQVDREALLNRFTAEELNTLRNIHPAVFSNFEMQELELLLAGERGQLSSLTMNEREVFNQLNDLISSSSNGIQLNATVYEEDFSGGIPDGWDISDDSESGFVWQLNNGSLDDDYDNYMIADSDEAGSGETVNSTLTTAPIDIAGLPEVFFAISHDYRHFGNQSGTIEWSTDGDTWNVLAEYTENNRVAEDVFDITEAVAGSDELSFRFVFDDAGGFTWWWGIDAIAILDEDPTPEPEPFDGITYTIPDVTLDGGNFINITGEEFLTGELTRLVGDFVLSQTGGFTWSNDLAILVTDQPDLGDEETNILLQVGGTSDFGAEQSISWPGGSGATAPVDGEAILDEPLELDGLYVWFGNGWGSGSGNAWEGTIGFDGVEGEFAPPPEFSNLQVVHNAADPALSEVDVYINGGLFAEGFPFRGATPYLEVEVGFDLFIEVYAAGADPVADDALLSTTFAPEVPESFALVAQGVANPGDFADNPDAQDIGAELVLLEDRAAAPAEEGDFSVYIYHGATDAPAVDIFVRELGDNIVEGAVYGDATGYFDFAPDVYAVEVRPAGSEEAVGTFFVDASSLGGATAGVFASGFLSPEDNQNGESLALNVVTNDGTVVTIEPSEGPLLSITPDELAFGAVVENFSSSLPVTFTNTGTSSLAITAAAIDNDAFSINFDDAILLPAGDSETFEVTFAPDAVDTFEGTLTVSSSDGMNPEQTVALSGEGVLAPEFSFDPETLDATLPTGESTTVEVTFSNDGDGELTYALPDYVSERLLDGTDTAFDAIREMLTTRITAPEANREMNRQANLERFMTGEREEAGRFVSAPAKPVTTGATAKSGGVTYGFESLTLAGGEFIEVGFNLSGELVSLDPDFVIDAAEGGTWANDFGVLFTSEPIEGEVDGETVVLQVGGFTTFGDERINWGEGSSGDPGTAVTSVVELPTPLDPSGLYVYIGNAWATSSGGTWTGSITLNGVSEGADFITAAEPASGNLAAGESETVSLTFDADGLIGGLYEGVLNVATNDPENLEVAIPASLTVEGEAEITVEPDALDFGDVFIGEFAVAEATVTNTGTDVLSVTGLSTDDEQFMVEDMAFDLEVGESAAVEVTYTPDAAGEASATLTIASNAGDATVALSGEAAEPGILEFDPESLTVSVEEGGTGTASFTISNTGPSPFEYSFGGGLVEEDARFLNPIGNVTEINVPGSAGSKMFGSESSFGVSEGKVERNNKRNNGTSGFVTRPALADEVVLTHSASQTIAETTGVRCGSPGSTADNSFMRTYTLEDFGITGDFNVTTVEFGAESVIGSITADVNVYSLEGDFVLENLTLLGSGSITLDSSADLSVVSVPVEAEVPAGATMVAEVFIGESETSDFFPGANSEGQTAPGYIVGPECGIDQPTDYADIGFPEVHLVHNVIGEAGDGIFTFGPEEGTLAAGESAEIEVIVDAAELEAGSYDAAIEIITSSPATPLGILPVSLEVGAAASEMVTFQVDMSIQEADGVFQPGVGDEVYLRGGFNDFSLDNPLSEEDGLYTATLELAGGAGDSYDYKYYIVAGDDRSLPNDGWEGDVGPGENGNRVVDLVGDDQVLEPVFFNNITTDLEPGDELPAAFALNQNYPNPFNPTTNIEYALPEAADVTLEVYNLQGQRVAVLVNGQQSAGNYTVSFDAQNLASGMYLYRLQAGSFVQTQKMMLVK